MTQPLEESWRPRCDPGPKGEPGVAGSPARDPEVVGWPMTLGAGISGCPAGPKGPAGISGETPPPRE